MGILKGALSVRRYRVGTDHPEGWQDRFIGALNEHAFREPLSPVHKEEVSGWVQVHNLLDADFSDVNRWLYNQYAVFALRTDKKTLPAKLFAAHLQKRVEAWCAANQRERAPRSEKERIKEELEQDLLRQTLPSVTLVEVAWNVAEGWLLVHSHAEAANDRFRKLFHRTFGQVAVPFDPLDFVSDWPEVGERLRASGASDLREGA